MLPWIEVIRSREGRKIGDQFLNPLLPSFRYHI